MQQDKHTPPLLYISYSHDSTEHLERVYELCERLRRLGFDCRTDQQEAFPAEGWQAWHTAQVARADCVLVVCSRDYLEIFEERAEQEQGDLWRGPVLSPSLLNKLETRFVPVVFRREDVVNIPAPFAPLSHFFLSEARGMELLAVYLGEKLGLPPGEMAVSLPSLQRRQAFAAPLPVCKPWRVPEERSPFYCAREKEQRELDALCRDATACCVTAAVSGVGRSQLIIDYATRHQQDLMAVLWMDWGVESFLRYELAACTMSLGLPVDTDQPARVLREWLTRHQNWLLVLRGWPNGRWDGLLPREHGGCVVRLPKPGEELDESALFLDSMPDNEALGLLRGRSGRRALKQTERMAALYLVNALGGNALMIDLLGVLAAKTERSFQDLAESLNEEGDIQHAVVRQCLGLLRPEVHAALALCCIRGGGRMPLGPMLRCLGLDAEQGGESLQEGAACGVLHLYAQESACAPASGLCGLARGLMEHDKRRTLLESLRREIKTDLASGVREQGLFYESCLQSVERELRSLRDNSAGSAPNGQYVVNGGANSQPFQEMLTECAQELVSEIVLPPMVEVEPHDEETRDAPPSMGAGELRSETERPPESEAAGHDAGIGEQEDVQDDVSEMMWQPEAGCGERDGVGRGACVERKAFICQEDCEQDLYNWEMGEFKLAKGEDELPLRMGAEGADAEPPALPDPEEQEMENANRAAEHTADGFRESTEAAATAPHEPHVSDQVELGREGEQDAEVELQSRLPDMREPETRQDAPSSSSGIVQSMVSMVGRFFFRSKRGGSPGAEAQKSVPGASIQPDVVFREPVAERPRAPSVRPADSEPDLPATAAECVRRAKSHISAGNYADAEPFYARALQLQEKLHGPDHLATARAANVLGELYRRLGELELSESLLERALNIRVSIWGDEHREVAESCTNLGSLRLAQGLKAEAEALYVRALRMDEALFGKEHSATATDCNNLAVLYFKMERFAEALRNIKRAIAIREATLGKGHPLHVQACENCAAILRKLGRAREAEEIMIHARQTTQPVDETSATRESAPAAREAVEKEQIREKKQDDTDGA